MKVEQLREQVGLGIRRVTLESYGGARACTDLSAPEDEAALARCLRYAVAHGRKVSFRSGGRAFDTQSLNDDLVISLERFTAVRVDAVRGTVTVGAGARWGEILGATAEHGLVPHAMVTSRRAAAGGTVSADSVSRFTPSCGTEGAHVVSLRLMRMDGHVLVCSPTENVATFRAVVGGLGYLGAVLEVTHALVRLGYAAPRIAVETVFTPFQGYSALERALADVRETSDGEPPEGCSAVLELGRDVRGFVMHSRYVDRAPTEHSPTAMHAPSSFWHAVLQVVASVETTRRIGWRIFLAWLLRKPRVYVDELFGFTFFQDGNERVKRAGRALGLPFGARQQSFFVPKDALRTFLDRSHDAFASSRLDVALVDVLPVPARTSPSLLSSNRGSAGFIVSFAFEHALRRRFPREEQAYRALALVAESLGGRVHLMKHVYADPDAIARMYPDLAVLAEHKRALDPMGTLDNAFMRRVFRALAIGAHEAREVVGAVAD